MGNIDDEKAIMCRELMWGGQKSERAHICIVCMHVWLLLLLYMRMYKYEERKRNNETSLMNLCQNMATRVAGRADKRSSSRAGGEQSV